MASMKKSTFTRRIRTPADSLQTPGSSAPYSEQPAALATAARNHSNIVLQALPAGTRPSVHNGQLLISSGLHDLDGLPKIPSDREPR